MAGSINRATLLGNLGRDPEIRTTQDGREIATLSVATSESWKDRNTGERKERVEWHRVVVFNEALVKVAKEYLRKGSRLIVEGQIQTRKWTDQSGQEKYATEIVLQNFGATLVLLDGRSDGGEREAAAPTAASQPARHADLDDEIPF